MAGVGDKVWGCYGAFTLPRTEIGTCQTASKGTACEFGLKGVANQSAVLGITVVGWVDGDITGYT